MKVKTSIFMTGQNLELLFQMREYMSGCMRVRGVLDRFPKAVYERNRNRDTHSPFFDDWGNGQMEIGPDNWYPGIHPMSDALTIENLDAYPWPDMDDPYRTAHVREIALKLHQENQYAILATPWLMFPLSAPLGCKVWINS